ncbi:MAG: EscU/YscU/HrcU family type III secretion system export apparatus switch protein [Lachnospiraceae bacterium]
MSEFDHLMKKKAVALKYDPEKNGAPVVVASGMGYMAEKITEAAMNAGIPVYEDDSLATLLSQIKLGSAIPEELYQAVVDIYVYFLNYVPDRKAEQTEEVNEE